MNLTKITLVLIIFHSFAYANDSLQLILDLAQKAKQSGQKPVIVFDLDDTLFLTSSRSLKIVQEFIGQKDILSEFPEESKILSKMKENDFLYSFKDTLIKMNITNEQFIILLSTFWKKAFFQNSYIAEDKMINSASIFLNCLTNKHGIDLIYLTGRPMMNLKGTKESLIKNNFPLTNTNARLILNSGKYKNTIEYKKQTMIEISQTSPIIASFENESKNLQMMDENFPDAVMIFLDIKQSAIAKQFVPDLVIKDYKTASKFCLQTAPL